MEGGLGWELGFCLEALHDGAESDVAPVAGTPRAVVRVAELGLEVLDGCEVDLQLPDQLGPGDHDAELQVAVPRRLVGRVVLAVEAVLDPADLDPVGLEPADRGVDLGDVVAHNARAAKVLQCIAVRWQGAGMGRPTCERHR